MSLGKFLVKVGQLHTKTYTLTIFASSSSAAERIASALAAKPICPQIVVGVSDEPVINAFPAVIETRFLPEDQPWPDPLEEVRQEGDPHKIALRACQLLTDACSQPGTPDRDLTTHALALARAAVEKSKKRLN